MVVDGDYLLRHYVEELDKVIEDKNRYIRVSHSGYGTHIVVVPPEKDFTEAMQLVRLNCPASTSIEEITADQLDNI